MAFLVDSVVFSASIFLFICHCTHLSYNESVLQVIWFCKYTVQYGNALTNQSLEKSNAIIFDTFNQVKTLCTLPPTVHLCSITPT